MSPWRSRLRREGPALAALALVAAVGLGLRLVNNDYGLPYVYNQDEGSHFTNRAVEMFGGDPDPGYYQNPSAFTYLVHAALRLRWGSGWPFGDLEAVVRSFSRDPSLVYVTARTTAALIGVAGVLAVYAVGRRLWDRRTGLVAAAVIAFAFLPVAYSRVALTDVGTLLPVALTLGLAVRLHDTGGLRWAAAAGAAGGLAVGFKYTSGLVLLAPLAALALRAAAERGLAAWRAAGLGALVVGGVALVAFFITTPYFFLELGDARRQLSAQTDRASAQPKFGQGESSGFAYYAESLTWGLGWAALVAAIAGAVIVARRDRARAVVLLIFPLALFLYLSLQARFFGRWLLPAYPALALLAGVAVTTAASRLRTAAPRLECAAVALGALVLVWQGLAADARSVTVQGKPDTRDVARRWLVAHTRTGVRTIIEPAVPARYYRERQVKHSRYAFVNEFVQDVRRTRIEYGATLEPGVIDQYREQGYCTVVTMSVIEGRAEVARDRDSLAYYARLKRESRRLFSVSPYRADSTPPAFDFDLSYNSYSRAYRLPGPEVDIYRLNGCRQRYGGGGAPPEVAA